MVYTFDGTTGKIYIDTVLVYSVAVDQDAAAAVAFTLLTTLFGSWWPGEVQAFAVWEAALTLAQIEADAEELTPQLLTDLWAFWLLNGVNDVADRSGNGRHLTKVGTPTAVTSSGVALGGSALSPAAVRVPIDTGLILPLSAGIPGDFTLAFHIRVDSRPEQYTCFMKTIGGAFLWFGVDYGAGGGTRNIACLGTGFGGHCFGAWPTDGVWHHVVITVESGVAYAWLNKVQQEWDGSGGAPGHPEQPLGASSWPSATDVEFFNAGVDDTGSNLNGAVRGLYFAWGSIGASGPAAVDELYAKSAPELDDVGMTTIGLFPLITKDDLRNSAGGADLTVDRGPLGADTTGPGAITAP